MKLRDKSFLILATLVCLLMAGCVFNQCTYVDVMVGHWITCLVLVDIALRCLCVNANL